MAHGQDWNRMSKVELVSLEGVWGHGGLGSAVETFGADDLGVLLLTRFVCF